MAQPFQNWLSNLPWSLSISGIRKSQRQVSGRWRKEKVLYAVCLYFRSSPTRGHDLAWTLSFSPFGFLKFGLFLMPLCVYVFFYSSSWAFNKMRCQKKNIFVQNFIVLKANTTRRYISFSFKMNTFWLGYKCEVCVDVNNLLGIFFFSYLATKLSYIRVTSFSSQKHMDGERKFSLWAGCRTLDI